MTFTVGENATETSGHNVLIFNESPSKRSDSMKHWCSLIPWQKALSGNNVFLSALPCLTNDRKTAGHNYPVCSQTDGFYYLNLFGRERELGGASLYHFLVMLCVSALMSLSVICRRFVLLMFLNEGTQAFPWVREATPWCKKLKFEQIVGSESHGRPTTRLGNKI